MTLDCAIYPNLAAERNAIVRLLTHPYDELDSRQLAIESDSTVASAFTGIVLYVLVAGALAIAFGFSVHDHVDGALTVTILASIAVFSLAFTPMLRSVRTAVKLAAGKTTAPDPIARLRHRLWRVRAINNRVKMSLSTLAIGLGIIIPIYLTVVSSRPNDWSHMTLAIVVGLVAAVVLALLIVTPSNLAAKLVKKRRLA